MSRRHSLAAEKTSSRCGLDRFLSLVGDRVRDCALAPSQEDERQRQDFLFALVLLTAWAMMFAVTGPLRQRRFA
jgi:hypothetical protein